LLPFSEEKHRKIIHSRVPSALLSRAQDRREMRKASVRENRL
jgi:hypothetical protein